MSLGGCNGLRAQNLNVMGKMQVSSFTLKSTHLADHGPRPGQVDHEREVRLVGRVELQGARRLLGEAPELGALRRGAI